MNLPYYEVEAHRDRSTVDYKRKVTNIGEAKRLAERAGKRGYDVRVTHYFQGSEPGALAYQLVLEVEATVLPPWGSWETVNRARWRA